MKRVGQRMKINNIVKLDLETRAKDLRAAGKSHAEIAKVLSEENKVTITKDSVQRYFSSDNNAKAQVIEKQDKLKAKVIDADINTIGKRVQIIDFLLKIAVDMHRQGESKTAVLALRAATEAQDSLDQRLGKLKGPQPTNINILNVQEAVTSAREVLKSRISGMSARIAAD
jgi:carbamoylphosphate synthase small subunit